MGAHSTRDKHNNNQTTNPDILKAIMSMLKVHLIIITECNVF